MIKTGNIDVTHVPLCIVNHFVVKLFGGASVPMLAYWYSNYSDCSKYKDFTTTFSNGLKFIHWQNYHSSNTIFQWNFFYQDSNFQSIQLTINQAITWLNIFCKKLNKFAAIFIEESKVDNVISKITAIFSRLQDACCNYNEPILLFTSRASQITGNFTHRSKTSSR